MLSKSRATAFSAIATTAALALSLVGAATPAQAFATLTADQWNAEANTVALHAAMDKSDQLLAGINMLDLSMTIEDDGSSHTTETITARANKTSTVAHYASTDLDTNTKNSFDYYFKNGTYIESLESFQSGPTWVNDLDATLKRIGKVNINSVNDHSATKLVGLPDISPATIWSAAERDPFIGAAQGNPVTYGSVYIGSDQLGENNVVYRWEGEFTANVGIPVTVNVYASATFNPDGLMIAQSLQEVASPYFTITMSQTLKPSVDTMMAFPAPEFILDAAQVIKVGHQIDAEKSLSKSVSALVKKAKALGKSKVAGGHIVSAAKALKLKYKAVKNGVKLSAIKSNVTGSICVVAKNGKATSAPCN